MLLVHFAGNFGCPQRTSEPMIVTPPGDTVGQDVPISIDICTTPPLVNLDLHDIAPGSSSS